jgi:peptidoglycan hydrolase CwlO-like protein
MLTAGYGPGYNGPLLVAASLDPVATPSQEYDDQYAEANDLKADLEDKQKTLTAQADALTAQQKELEQEQASLERQKAKLEKQGKVLTREKAQLEREQAQLLAEQRALQAEARALEADARRLVAREKALTRQIVALDARIAALVAAIAVATDPVVKAGLEADLALRRAERTELVAARRATSRELRAVVRQARTLPARRQALQQQAADLRDQGIALQRQADALEQQAAQLEREADALQRQAAALQQQADELRQEQAQAEAEQASAEQLQASLTDMLTKAGGDPRGTDPRVVTLQDVLATPAGVLLVSPPKINPSGTALTFTVVPTTRPADPATAALVVAERAVIPDATEGTGVVAHVGGSTAGNVDLAALITEKLPLVILTVLALSFVLLLIAFRSLLVPLQAAVMNLISVGAAFGILTAAFQWGWAIPYIGPDTAYGSVPIPSYVPLMMFAALFGLSMDYEVFLVSHIQGRHLAGLGAREAVREGLAASGKVIVAAAAIMISVFGSFILSADPTIKQFGVGLASAVFLAALMVMLFAPAVLVIFGETTWRVPRFLDRVLPHMDLEGSAPALPVAGATAPDEMADQAD